MKKLLLVLLLLTACTRTTSTEIYFCPAENCQYQVVSELAKANESIYFMTYSFTDMRIAEMLVEKNKNLTVEGVMERQRVTSKFNVYPYLNESGVLVTLDNNRAIMHNKIFIIDAETVVTGSYNPTENGNENNNENVVILHDRRIAKRYVEEYFRIKSYK